MTETALKTSEPQRLAALERANQVRLARAALKRSIAIGQVSAAEVIRDCPEAAHRWPIGELLMSQRRWGSTRCRKFLSTNQIGETKPIGQLTPRQRQLLAGSLEGSATPARVVA
ncbi:MAG: integration host factor, actinobacterial type [Solirubrobacteraceae bacterium]